MAERVRDGRESVDSTSEVPPAFRGRHHADAFAARYERVRRRTAHLFSLLDEAAFYEQPIALRHPVVFYEGHLPAFSFNTLVKKALGEPAIDTRLEALFARGIDPDQPGERACTWPSRAEVQAFAAEADRRVFAALAHAELDRPGDPYLDRSAAVHAILEHEAMHQETLLYMWQQLPYDLKRKPEGYRPCVDARLPAREWIDVPRGCATLGVSRDKVPFGWDNEFPARAEDVAAFRMERHDVTNARFLEFVDAGGYTTRDWWTAEDWAWIASERRDHPAFWERAGAEWYWRGMFERVPLPPSWPVYVTLAEAAAFARWSGARLPTEAEFQRAAYGSSSGERFHPWGTEDLDADRGVFDFSGWDPAPAGTHPAGASAWGIEDLVGNGWEWTRSAFAPFPGFQTMASYPEYSADFFDGQHFVMKGASPVTARELLRPTFRNWFRRRYPYVYATFRCVTDSRPRV
jgi:ergothioneine biosynthesis protein EgtB